MVAQQCSKFKYLQNIFSEKVIVELFAHPPTHAVTLPRYWLGRTHFSVCLFVCPSVTAALELNSSFAFFHLGHLCCCQGKQLLCCMYMYYSGTKEVVGFLHDPREHQSAYFLETRLGAFPLLERIDRVTDRQTDREAD